MNGPSRRRKRRPAAVSDAWKAFRDVVARALKPVRAAPGEALARLAEHGVTGRAYFNAGKGLLIA